ncbi:MAG TPA: hypothetical protein PLK04_10650 [Bacillota bacterium]|nr:hypothetical protein [Bacillota bacterium]
MVSIREKFGSGQVSNDDGDISLTLNYWVFGTKSEVTAHDMIAAYNPPIRTIGAGKYRRESIRVEQVANAWNGREAWDGTVVYRLISQNIRIEYQGTTGNTTTHVNVAKGIIGAYARQGETAPDLQGVIGFDGQDIQGADILVPQPEFSISVEPINITDPNAFLRSIAMLVGKVNSNTYLGFSPGELLFSGADHSGATDKPFTVTYRFQCSPTLRDFTVGGIRVPMKRGWDYLDVYYEREVDQNAKVMIKRPRAVYVYRVYDYAFFAFPGLDY